jgi:K+-transporting ATPase ATPase B chain
VKQKRIISNLNLAQAMRGTWSKLAPKDQVKNPVMLVVYLGAILSTGLFARELVLGQFSSLHLQVCLWLWFTLLFANFAESVAELKGKAQAESLKKNKSEMTAKVLQGDGSNHERFQVVSATELDKGMLVFCQAGDFIPADGDVIEGIASVDESAITGESAPVIREAGGDRTGVMAGTRVTSDWIKMVVSTHPGESYLDKMISLIESAKRRPTPNEEALNVVLVALTTVFIFVVIGFKCFLTYSESAASIAALQDSYFLSNSPQIEASASGTYHVSGIDLIALLVCLIPTTISGLLSAVGISGMERLLKKNVVAMSGKAVEMAGDIDVLLLDKTGTITHGARQCFELIPEKNISYEELAAGAQMSSAQDLTPEGKSIVSHVAIQYPKVASLNIFGEGKEVEAGEESGPREEVFTPFSAETRMSGVDVLGPNKEVILEIRKGAVNAILQYLHSHGGTISIEMKESIANVSRAGGTPLLVATKGRALGLIYLKDIIKTGVKERFIELRGMGIKTVMVTGDNPLTASTIAAEAGVDDFLAEATPQAKLERIVLEQKNGHRVAMVGDGTNDAPALAQADIGVAMNSGTQAAKESANLLDLDSDPTKLLEIVETGKELLMTRGALTTFSVANDVAKYFTILPAMLSGTYVMKGKSIFTALDILHLHGPESAILSVVIFNALIIVALIPLALKGVTMKKSMNSEQQLRRNVLIYGLGGLIAPFIGIKVIDVIIVFLHLI